MSQSGNGNNCGSILSELALMYTELLENISEYTLGVSGKVKEDMKKITDKLNSFWAELGYNTEEMKQIAKLPLSSESTAVKLPEQSEHANVLEVLLRICTINEYLHAYVPKLAEDFRIYSLFKDFQKSYTENLLQNGIKIHSLEIGEEYTGNNWSDGVKQNTNDKSLDMRVSNVMDRGYEIDGELIMKQKFTYYSYAGGSP